ncbi:hypothetical protein Sinac_3579 [Singulisphaera acidiphila DSM 18658]|uniref:Uncharacterized protein n=1 Tax=Singulisphaera acidiphila (strain ATCC BAA-1392 / DSM 18658 / VKM B-2454 / MOB10) TaxID=886293 RepID=L0DEY6_SINAD|nr:hypothetical protein Sinac_3579 [Singulisphaera acidiphila DSM 18658]
MIVATKAISVICASLLSMHHRAGEVGIEGLPIVGRAFALDGEQLATSITLPKQR